MEVHARDFDGARIVELVGPFPGSSAQLSKLSNRLKAEVQSAEKPVMISLQNVHELQSIHLGVLVGALAGKPRPWVFISQDDRIRDLVTVIGSSIRIFTSETEVLSYLRQSNKGCGVVLAVLPIVVWLAVVLMRAV